MLLQWEIMLKSLLISLQKKLLGKNNFLIKRSFYEDVIQSKS